MDYMFPEMHFEELQPMRKDYKPPQSAPPLKYRQRERAKVEAKIVLRKDYFD